MVERLVPSEVDYLATSLLRTVVNLAIRSLPRVSEII